MSEPRPSATFRNFLGFLTLDYSGWGGNRQGPNRCSGLKTIEIYVRFEVTFVRIVMW
jgi:hypothetical protein